MKKTICWMIAVLFLFTFGCTNKEGEGLQQGDIFDALTQIPITTSDANNNQQIPEEQDQHETVYVYLLTKVTATGNLLTGNDKGEYGGIGPGVGLFHYDSLGNLVSKEWTGTEDVMWYTQNDPSFYHLTEWTYDKEGRKSTKNETISGTINGEATKAVYTEAWSYNKNGHVSKHEYTSDVPWNSSVNGITTEEYAYEYDSAGRIIHKAETINGKTYNYDYVYNEHGKKTSETKSYIETDGNKSVVKTYLWYYDEKGRLVSTVSKDSIGLTESETTYLYDDDGHLISETKKGLLSTDEYIYEYSETGDLLARTYYYAAKDQQLQYQSKIVYERDLDGRLLCEESYNNRLIYRILYSYYSNGQLQQKQKIVDSSEWMSEHVRYTWQYDENGNLLLYRVERFDHPEEKYRLFELIYEYEKRSVS